MRDEREWARKKHKERVREQVKGLGFACKERANQREAVMRKQECPWVPFVGSFGIEVITEGTN